jgi:hypothetical protein
MDSPRLQSGSLHERPILPRAIVTYPFADRQVPDVATKAYEQHYLVARARYSPALATRSPAPPTFSGAYLGPADLADTSAYLAHELYKPIDQLRARVERTFAHIPADQTSYDTRSFSRPRLDDLVLAGGLSSVWAVSFDDDSSVLFFSRTAATIGAIDVPLLTEGNTFGSLGHSLITIEMNNSVQTFYADDTDATIKDALSYATVGNTSYAANFKIVRSAARIEIFVTYAQVTINALSSSADSIEVGISSGVNIGLLTGTYQSIFTITTSASSADSIRRITTAITAAAGKWMALWNGDKVVARGKVVATDGSTYSDLQLSDVPGKDFAVTHAALASSGLRLVHGAKDCTIKIVDKFYGATVTAGIATLADVPAVPVYTDPIAWLGRILATTLTSVACATATNRFNKTAHGLSTGDTFFVLAKTGASGLATLTQYWALRVDANYFYACSSPEQAFAGVGLAVGSDGSAMSILVPAPYAAIGVSKLESYMGFIVSKTTESVQLSDAIETRNAAA